MNKYIYRIYKKEKYKIVYEELKYLDMREVLNYDDNVKFKMYNVTRNYRCNKNTY